MARERGADRVGAPDGVLEREAERVAIDVVRAPGPDGSAIAAPRSRAAAVAPARTPLVPPGGRPLDPPVRRYFEPRLGVDLEHVRVHTGPAAAKHALALRAAAFTTGRHIVFGTNRYAPATAAGRRLLAHELAHVVQQAGGLDGREHARQGAPSEEQAVTRAASSAKADARAPGIVHAAPPGLVQRDVDDEAAAGDDDRIEAYIFVYAQDDPEFESVWRESAEFFARSHDGLAVEGASNTSETLRNILDAYDPERYSCIRAIEFFGHGTAGEALSGGFEAADFEAAERMATASETERELDEILHGESQVRRNIQLHERLLEVRELLCGDSFFHFRTCETLEGEEGETFARETATRFGTHVMGYSEIIDTLLPGRRVFDPEGREREALPETLMPPRRPVSELPFRYFEVELDTTGLTLPDVGSLLGTAFPTVVLGAEVLENPENPATYLIRLEAREPRFVRLPEIGRMLADLLPDAPGGDDAPTARAIREWLEMHGTEGRFIEVPIDHRVVRAFSRAAPRLRFELPLDDYGTATITIRGVTSPPSWISEHGGIEVGADLGVIAASEQVRELVRPFVRIPLWDERSILRLGLELGVPAGRDTIAVDLRLPFSVQAPRVTELGLAPRFSIAPVVGYGRYLGETGLAAGGGFEVGTTISDADLALRADFLKTPHAGMTTMLMLRLGWVFE